MSGLVASVPSGSRNWTHSKRRSREERRNNGGYNLEFVELLELTFFIKTQYWFAEEEFILIIFFQNGFFLISLKMCIYSVIWINFYFKATVIVHEKKSRSQYLSAPLPYIEKLEMLLFQQYLRHDQTQYSLTTKR